MILNLGITVISEYTQSYKRVLQLHCCYRILPHKIKLPSLIEKTSVLLGALKKFINHGSNQFFREHILKEELSGRFSTLTPFQRKEKISAAANIGITPTALNKTSELLRTSLNIILTVTINQSNFILKR